ncbi:MAG: hypothetical protein OEN50_14655 [Deltaproteobacteria bacterium]|nr:hypothetical protein [Deltaproteobacteria bacterium]
MTFSPLTLRTANILVLSAAVMFFLCNVSSTAYAQESFFEGKTLTIIEGRAPGGTGDIRVRTLVPFLEKYIPGNPKIILEYMPGGGSRIAANHLFSSARPDGLTIGNMSSGVVSLGILKATGVLYDLDKFVFLGSPFSVHQAVLVTRKALGLDSIEKLRAAKGVRIGGQSVGFSTYNEGRLFAYIIGLNDPVFITGYAGAEIDPAMMRGELDGRATSGDTVLRRNPEWLKGDLIDFQSILEVPKGTKHDHPIFAKLPTLESLAKTDLHRKVIGMQRAFRLVGQPFIAPPGIPADRLAMIQEGFRKTFQDPEFKKAYEKFTASDATPIMPEDHAQAVKDIPRDPEVVEIFEKLVGGGPLPPR